MDKIESMVGEVFSYNKNKKILFSHYSNTRGTCFKANGHIITCYHVISNYDRLEIRHRNKRYDATVAALIPEFDLAILKSDAPMVNLRIEERVLVGEHIEVIGYPCGSTGSVITAGTVSGAMLTDIGFTFSTSCHVYNGISGGPAINDDGDVVGITKIKSSQPDFYESGLIPSQNALHCIRLLKFPLEGKRPGPIQGLANLKLRTQNVEKVKHSIISRYGAADNGLVVNLSQEKEIHKDDIILSIDNKPIHSGSVNLRDYSVPYYYYLMLKVPKEKISLQILRNGKEITITTEIQIDIKKMAWIPEEVTNDDIIKIGNYTFYRYNMVIYEELKDNDEAKVALLLDRFYHYSDPLPYLLIEAPQEENLTNFSVLGKHDKNEIVLSNPPNRILL